MEKIGAYEAKTHLPKLLERVMKGEQIMITKYGKPVAVLKAPDLDKPKAKPAKTIQEIRKFRKACHLQGLSLRELIDEGRK